MQKRNLRVAGKISGNCRLFRQALFPNFLFLSSFIFAFSPTHPQPSRVIVYVFKSHLHETLFRVERGGLIGIMFSRGIPFQGLSSGRQEKGMKEWHPDRRRRRKNIVRNE